MPNRRNPTRNARRRGTVFVLVLGVVAILVVFGVAGAMLARNVNERGVLKEDQARAQVLAESYLDLIHARLDGGTTWRSVTQNDTWSSPAEALAGGVMQYKLVDELDGSLSNGDTHPVRLYARASVGGAVRVYSIELTCPNSSTLHRESATFRRDANE